MSPAHNNPMKRCAGISWIRGRKRRIESFAASPSSTAAKYQYVGRLKSNTARNTNTADVSTANINPGVLNKNLSNADANERWATDVHARREWPRRASIRRANFTMAIAFASRWNRISTAIYTSFTLKATGSRR
jgi:hypothetical protein